MKGITVKYVCKRFISALFTLWVALTFNFLLPRMMGGDPAEYLASQSALGSAEYAQQVREQFGLDKSIFEQYARYLGGLFQGDLGVSYTNFPIPVSDIITQAIPWTLLVVIISTLLSFLIAWIIGTLAALKKGSWFDNLAVGTSFYIQSIPYFWVGMLLVMGLGYYLGWFPMGHAMTPGAELGNFWAKAGNIAYHACLPVLSLVIVSLAGRMIMMRSNILQVFSEDYIVLAQAKGLRRSKILTKYALRNALLPSFTGLMLSLGQAVGGAIATEIIFSYPGIGLTIMNAILSHDYPLVQGCFAIIALSVVAINFLADLIYPLIDPRVSLD
ncbi:ABC transporter permease [Oscillospiraceae bacterium 21-37]|uniref:ABC transporter permease n=1 Tax=Eubacteriales TaxID=186802 RepID=UPI001369E0F4|nr:MULTISPECIES: ABC transporter permease [unclassified Neglectibacter]MCI8920835.1 ABC transporter permease [Acutalibacter sp.]NBI17779.1 ABC transporter permease [Neglectibacter sp. 59]NBJ73317.1 ABC transporter permease [Neglectibacter sp. X4]NCE81231.1 ABC transporter permease [Neglectibacter sp. X58]